LSGRGGERVLVAEQRALDLLPRRRRLNDHAWVVTTRLLNGPVELLRPGRGGDPDAGAEAGRLHPQGGPEPPGPLPPPVSADAAVVHLGQPMPRQQVLEDELVHADGGGLDVGPGVWDVEALEQALDAAVLTARAMQHWERSIAAKQALARGDAHWLALPQPAP